MESGKTNNRIHPLVATAAVAVTLASLVAIAAMTGMLPSSHSGTASAPNAAPPEPAQLAAAPLAAPTTAIAPQELNQQEAGNKAAASPRAPIPAPARPKAAPARELAPPAPQPAAVVHAPAICESCGRIESIRAIQHAAPPSGLGIAAGAVVGGLLGNQVGGGNGRTLATVAGAVGGGYAGNEVEKRSRTSTTYEIRVRMENGTLRTFPQSNPNGWQVGDPVRVVNGTLTSLG